MEQNNPKIKVVKNTNNIDISKFNDADIVIFVPESYGEKETLEAINLATKKFDELMEVSNYEKPIIRKKRPRIKRYE